MAHLAICTRLALSYSLCESPSLFTCLLVRLFLLLPDSLYSHNIYINNQADIIEDKLVTYLEEKKADKKVSEFTLKLLSNYLIFF
jgi:hypothetical protein